MSNEGVHGTIVGYILRASTHGIYMEKLNTFLRLVKTVLVGYATAKLDRIPFICYFFKSICIYIRSIMG